MVEDVLKAVVERVMKIHISEPEGDILVFMTGQEDIHACCSLIAHRLGLVSFHLNSISGL